MDIKKKIAELQKKGFNKSQAGIIALQQGGLVNNRYNYDKSGNTDITPQEARLLSENADGMGLRFTEDFAQNYFSKNTVLPTPPPPKKNYSELPILDITSDGQFTDRKVWRTQRPEWFVGKKEPVEGVDYTIVPHRQWKEYQNSPEYSIFRKKATGLASLQQGGYWDANNPYFMQNPGMNYNVPQQPTPYSSQYTVPPQPTYGTLPTNLPPNQGYQPTDYTQNFTAPTYSAENFAFNVVPQESGITTPSATPSVNPLSADAGSGYRTDDYGNPIQSQQFFAGNPFGGYSTDMSLYMFGQGLGEKDPYKTATGGALSALKLGRIGIGGYASGKENRRVEDEYRRKLYEDNRPTTNLQQGGSTKELTNAEVLTGSYAPGNPNGNVIVEDKEQIKDNQTGEIREAVGNKHVDGGIPISLEDGKVLSNFTKIGAKNAKELKERYNLSLKKTDTFAKVMDKVNKKIGIDKLTEEQAKAIEKLGDNEYIKDQTTKTLNEKLLTKQVEDSQAKLDALKGAQNFAFEDIFALQEAEGKVGNGELINPDGSPMEVKGQEVPVMQQGGHIYDLAKKHNISSERAMELYQQGGETAQEQPVSQAPQEVQQPSPEQIIQAFAQATQQDPQVIVEQLQQLAPEEQQQALQSMVAQLQQQSGAQTQAPQPEQIAQAIQEGADPNQIVEQLIQGGAGHEEAMALVSQATGGQEVMQQGGVVYAQQGIDNTNPYLQNSTLLKNFTNAPSVLERLPYTPRETGTNEIWQGENYNKVWKPLVAKSLADPEQAKKIDTWLTENKDTFSPNIKKQLEGLSGEKRIQRIQQLATDEKPGLFHNAVLDAIKATTPVERPAYNYGQTVENLNAIPPDTSTGFVPYITPPSGRQGVILQTVQSPQYDRVKRSFEAGESAIASQADTKRQQVEATGLPPQIQEAIMAQDLATSQGASNQNIASVEGFNAANQQQVQNMQANSDFKTNLFNLGERDKYFVRNTAAIDNAEKEQRMYNDDFNRLGYRTYKDAMQRSLINATADNYRINNNGSLTFLEPRSQFVPGDNRAYEDWYSKLTPSDQEFERKRLAKEILDKANAQKKQNASRQTRIN